MERNGKSAGRNPLDAISSQLFERVQAAGDGGWDINDPESVNALFDGLVRDHVQLAVQTHRLSKWLKQAMIERAVQATAPPGAREDGGYLFTSAGYSGVHQRYDDAKPIPEPLHMQPEWRFVQQAVEESKTAFYDLSHRLQIDPDPEPKEEHRRRCGEVLDQFNERLRKTAALLEGYQYADSVWGYAFKEIFPYFLRSRFAERTYSKPKGYAGDFQMIEMLYNNQPDGDGKLGRLVDAWCLETATARAVRGRRKLLTQLLAKFTYARRNQNDPIRVLNLGCGSNRELFDFLAHCDYDNRIEAVCVDTDRDALTFTNHHVNVFHHRASVKLLDDNVARWSVGKGRHSYGPQDLIYSSGLTDYFGARMFRALATRCYDHLRPGGVLIIGNFGDTNPHRAFMDHIIHWRLIHRSEEEFRNLFSDTPFGSRVKVIAEPQSINLFAIAQKPAR
ncbi:MAG: methyltransferase domain-containing protein [bacterium]|nr:methyltransferase domain-containing protein [bacterium]